MGKKQNGSEKNVEEQKPKAEKPKKKNQDKTKRVLEDPRPDVSKLPEHVLKKRIQCKSTVSDEVLEVTLAEITGTSKNSYVNDIHAVNPTILEEVYWVNMHGERWPLGRVSKEDYEFVRKNAKLPPERHIIAVIDCAVNPTLSYGWTMAALGGKDFPTLEHVEEQDKRFKENPTFFHNRSPKFVVKEANQEQADLEDDDDFIIMDDDELEETSQENPDEEEFTFDD